MFRVELVPRAARGTIGREHEPVDSERRSVRTASLLVSVTVNRGVAANGSPAALIGGTILIPLWLGLGLGHAPRGPGAAGKESHYPGPAPPPRLALDDPFKMPPSAGLSRIAVEVEPLDSPESTTPQRPNRNQNPPTSVKTAPAVPSGRRLAMHTSRAYAHRPSVSARLKTRS